MESSKQQPSDPTDRTDRTDEEQLRREHASLAALMLEGVEILRIEAGQAASPAYLAWQQKVMKQHRMLS